MESTSLAVQIIPDLTVDDKYATIIDEAHRRMSSFTDKALRDGRLGELFILDRTGLDHWSAEEILRTDGRLVVGFQFEHRPDPTDSNFQLFVKKTVSGTTEFKFYLSPTVQEIMFQLISLEDRRSVAVFSMLNSSLDLGYRILTSLYGTQLKRLVTAASPVVQDSLELKLEKLRVAKSVEDSDLWETAAVEKGKPSGQQKSTRPGTQDNILRVMADDSVFEDLNQYVGNVISKSERIREKRRTLEENPDIERSEMYEQMVLEDLDQLENCYARMHIYLRAFYKNQNRRTRIQNRILRQFFGGQIELIIGETTLLEDLLALNEDEYFKNIDRHKDL
jgi:hypothetical protein